MEKWLRDARKKIRKEAEHCCIECIRVAEEQEIENFYVAEMFIQEFRKLIKDPSKYKEYFEELYFGE